MTEGKKMNDGQKQKRKERKEKKTRAVEREKDEGRDGKENRGKCSIQEFSLHKKGGKWMIKICFHVH